VPRFMAAFSQLGAVLVCLGHGLQAFFLTEMQITNLRCL